MKSATCENCVYFVKGHRSQWDGSGLCYRYPIVTKRDAPDIRRGCGEFKVVIDAYASSTAEGA